MHSHKEWIKNDQENFTPIKQGANHHKNENEETKPATIILPKPKCISCSPLYSQKKKKKSELNI